MSQSEFFLYLVSVGHFEAYCDLQLAKADGTEIQGPTIRLLQVVGALHDAAQPLAMLNSKHMSNLVGHRLKRNISHSGSLIRKKATSSSIFFYQQDSKSKRRQTAQKVHSTKIDFVVKHDRNLAGPKQQSAGDGGSVISVKYRVVSRLWLKRFLQPPSITSTVEAVIIPGKAENTHSCKHSCETAADVGDELASGLNVNDLRHLVVAAAHYAIDYPDALH